MNFGSMENAQKILSEMSAGSATETFGGPSGGEGLIGPVEPSVVEPREGARMHDDGPAFGLPDISPFGPGSPFVDPTIWSEPFKGLF
jgi:hypothetical protein